MAALEVDSYKKRLLDASITGQGMTTAKVTFYFFSHANHTIHRLWTH